MPLAAITTACHLIRWFCTLTPSPVFRFFALRRNVHPLQGIAPNRVSLFERLEDAGSVGASERSWMYMGWPVPPPFAAFGYVNDKVHLCAACACACVRSR